MQNLTSILIVDDDPSARTMLAMCLRNAGFKVKTAPGGWEALELLHKEKFNWLITDGRMDPVDGFELAARAKRFNPGIRVIMTTAFYSQYDIEEAPIEKFYTKPLPVDDLMTFINSAQNP